MGEWELMNIICVIPARYASTRLPGKPLLDIEGKPMIQRVYEQAKKASCPTEVYVATDHEGVFSAVQAFGGKVIMTSSEHPTGTDRLAEVAAKLDTVDIIINVQGDEPLIEPSIIDDLAKAFEEDKDLVMATLATPMENEEFNEPSAVKVVTSLKGYALYFSRSLIPYPRVQDTGITVYKHIGIYAYKREFLLKYAKLTPTPLEKTESLEQLRALEYGYPIKVLTTKIRAIGVDTKEDLMKVREIFKHLKEENHS